MINLVIKGDMAAAFKAADARHIELTSLAAFMRWRQVAASCSLDHLEAVRAWFLEAHNPVLPGIGYSDGALLHYTTKCPVGIDPSE
jgi:hypothetical protein